MRVEDFPADSRSRRFSWRLPHANQQTRPGSLLRTAHEWEIELESPQQEYLEIDKVDVLLGEDASGHRVSAFECLPTHHGSGVMGLRPQWVVVGTHLPDGVASKVIAVRMRTNTLRSWIQYRPFSLGDEPDWPRTISVTEPMTREFAVPQRGLTLKLAAGPSISMSLAEIKASAVECIELVFTGDCTLEAAVERAVDIRHLLALLTGRWSQFTELLVVPRDGAPEDDERPHCPVWRPWTVVEDSGGEKDAFCSIPFSSIETSFAQILSTFLSADPRLQQVFAQLLGPWYRPPGYNYSKFLGLTQTAELFHRARFTGKYVDDDKWSPMADRIVASLPANLEPAHWEALKARLRFGNEFSLRKRLRELADSLSGQMADHVVKGTPSVDRIVNARNAVVHGPSADLQLPDGRELIDMVDSLRLLIETLCLLHIGVPQEAVLHGLAERREYLNLRARPNT